MSIQSHIAFLRETVPSGVTLVAVSKFHPAEVVREAYDAGLRVFGESRVQELIVKKDQLPEDIEWHFIGSLQRNKVKQIAPFISLIHSLDNERLMQEIEKQGQPIVGLSPVCCSFISPKRIQSPASHPMNVGVSFGRETGKRALTCGLSG